VAITMLFNACAKLAHTDAIQIATDVLTRMPTSFLYDHRLVNSALDMLMKFGDVNQAEHLFKQLKRKSIVSYGALMQGKQQE
jgi:pentatricopeptide repeat protein